jgi:putative ABC transport system ATP-binding protein
MTGGEQDSPAGGTAPADWSGDRSSDHGGQTIEEHEVGQVDRTTPVEDETGEEPPSTDDQVVSVSEDAPALELSAVTKRYESSAETVVALDSIDLTVTSGEFVTIMGPSGSGKSTMLNLLGLLDEPTSGTVRIGGQETGDLEDEQRTRLRKELLGFVFQDFYLLPTLSAVENVAIPTIFGDGEPARDRAVDLLERVGLGDRLEHEPNELSGGQQQRVAIARSLINEPRMVLADEPTGNLDRDTSHQVLDVLSGITEEGVSVVSVTHDELVTDYTDRTVELVDGSIR